MTQDDFVAVSDEEREAMRPRIVDKRTAGRKADADPSRTEDSLREASEATEADALRAYLIQEAGKTEEEVRALSIGELRKTVLEVQALVSEDAEAAPSDATRVLTAFVVYIGHDGHAVADSNLDRVFDVDRTATLNDMWIGAATVQRDIQESSTAQRTLVMMDQRAQALQAQMMQQRMQPAPPLKGVPRRG